MLIRMPEVMARTGLKRSTLYNLMNAGRFPVCVKISDRINGWPVAEIDDWIAARTAERKAA
jgi:prophage regulatory protein